jgi:phosphohistidine phosphatase
MALYLVQHGKSLPKDVDLDQGLSDEGKSEVQRITGVAEGYGVKVSKIAHSGKKRARQTAELFGTVLALQQDIKERDGLKPLDDVSTVAETLNTGENLMLVGHLPFMERLTNYLVTGSGDGLVFKFQNGGILCLDQDPENDSWFIKWSLMPHIE